MFFPSILQLFLRFIIVWVEFGLVFFLHSVDSRNPKTNLEPEWTFGAAEERCFFNVLRGFKDFLLVPGLPIK